MVDGGRYEGQFSRSRQHGEGTFYAPDGSIFKGEWKNGKPHGNGTFRTPEGRVTRGTWVDGVFQSEEPADPNRT
jgi:radial spoke head protein 1